MRARRRTRGAFIGAIFLAGLLLASFACGTFGADAAPVGPDATSADGTSSDQDGATPDGGASCVADFESDPRNCGSCGHDCLGGTCTKRACDPFVLVAGLSEPSNLTLGATRVFWEAKSSATKRDILGCARNGCPNPFLVLGGVDDVKAMLVEGGTLFFWTHDNTSTAQRLDACDVSTCASSRRNIEAPATNVFPQYTNLRLGSGGVFWGKQVTSAGEIRVFAPDASTDASTPRAVVHSSCIPARIALGASDVVWTCSGGSTISRCDLPCTIDGGVRLADAASPTNQLEHGNGWVVWDDDKGALFVLDGNGVRTLPGRGTGPIAVFGDDLFFYDGARKEIATCKLPSCGSRTTLAKTSANDIVVDDRAIYWVAPETSSIMGLAR
jgi:hypothetical protein